MKQKVKRAAGAAVVVAFVALVFFVARPVPMRVQVTFTGFYESRLNRHNECRFPPSTVCKFLRFDCRKMFGA
jgi:hypothetical protein